MWDKNQKTINSETTFSGIGLHSGIEAKVVLEPSNSNSGIVFKRTDLQKDNEIIAVGRSHLIPTGNNGSQADYVGPDAPTCPDFTPLTSGDFRPAIQIRQMGTKSQHRFKGYAAEVLSELEKKSIEIFSAQYGFLQARTPAIPFYQSQGWEIIDELFDIPGIGPHRSMMKKLA